MTKPAARGQIRTTHPVNINQIVGRKVIALAGVTAKHYEGGSVKFLFVVPAPEHGETGQ